MSSWGTGPVHLPRVALPALVAVVFCLGFAGAAAAAEPSLRPVPVTAAEGDLGALLAPVPALITGTADTGGQIRVDNVATIDQVYAISVQDYSLDANSRPIQAPPDFPYGSAAWYVFEDIEFVLPPGTSRDVKFTLDVPADAVPGDHFAALTVLVRAAQPPSSGSGTTVKSQLVFQIRLQHRIPGAEPREPRVLLDAEPGIGSVHFSARVTNDGNTVVTHQFEPFPTLQLTSTLPFADASRPTALTLDGFYVPPQSERLISLTWDDPPLIGAYHAVLTLPAVDGLPAVSAETSFVVIDWLRLGLLAAGLVVGLALLVVAARRTRRPSGRIHAGR